MTDGEHGTRSEDAPAETVHVFDQTNGVLGDQDEPDADERGAATTRSPSSFGVPPIASL